MLTPTRKAFVAAMIAASTVSLSLSAEARHVVDLTRSSVIPPPYYMGDVAHEYRNVFAKDYTWNFDSGYVANCKNRIAATPIPANHRVFAAISTPTLVRSFPDPTRPGIRYDDMFVRCTVTFINDATDCVHDGLVFANGEVRTDTRQDRINCLDVRTSFTCRMGAWSPSGNSNARIPRCIAR